MVKAEIVYFYGEKKTMEFGSLKRLGDFVARSSSVICFRVLDDKGLLHV